jgi:hypothetical protein
MPDYMQVEINSLSSDKGGNTHETLGTRKLRID